MDENAIASRIVDAFRADILVEGKVIVELKSVDQVLPVIKKATDNLPEADGLQTRPACQLRCRPD